jgi:excisionase family DNA binding protein
MAELIAVPAVMARLGIGRTKLYELIDSGELRSVKIGSRRFVTGAALDDFITRLDERAQRLTG